MSLLVNVAFEPLAILAIAIASLMSLFTAFASRRRASGRKAVTTGIPVYLDTGYPADDASIALDVPNSHSVHDFQCAKGFLLTLRDLKLHEDKQTGYNLPSVRTTGKQYCSKIDVTVREALAAWVHIEPQAFRASACPYVFIPWQLTDQPQLC